METADDDRRQEGRHADKDSDNEDADLHPRHPVVGPGEEVRLYLWQRRL